jgi:hypothetical protein
MIRFLLKITFPLTVFFLIPLLLIRAQPYEDSELRTFLMPPDGCPAPCFMGIQPGVTTMEEAIAILQAHEWVSEVSATSYNRLGINRVGWRWKPDVSPLLEPEQIPRSGGRLIADKGIVRYMELLTRVSAGEAWLILGKAQNYTSLLQLGGPISGPKPPKPITAIYSNMIFIAWTDCPYPRHFWDAHIELVIAESIGWLEQVGVYPIVSGDIPVARFVRELAQANCPRNP